MKRVVAFLTVGDEWDRDSIALELDGFSDFGTDNNATVYDSINDLLADLDDADPAILQDLYGHPIIQETPI